MILDCFGLMHAADQHAALAERAARVAPGGVLLLQYHSLNTIIRRGQWNALRHGHYAYYSTTALAAMLAAPGFSPRTAWQFDLYGGTVLLAASRDADGRQRTGRRGPVAARRGCPRRRPRSGTSAASSAMCRPTPRPCMTGSSAERSAGSTVLGYGAASRAVALLRQAQVDRTLLPAVVDASPAKQGLRMPGTDIPVVGPAQLAARRPDAVLLFVPDLLAEVRAAFPEVEAAGGRWVDADTLGSRSLQQHA